MILVSRDSLIALSEGELKYNPNLKIRFGRYIIKKPKLLVKRIGCEGKAKDPVPGLGVLNSEFWSTVGLRARDR